jgi:GT2 family glycosyltransferase
MTRDVTIIIVNWNAATVIAACLDSVLAQRYNAPVRILVVDNSSTDDSLELLKRYQPDVEVLELRENIGFAQGNNEGFRHAHSELVVFLNPDTEFVGAESLARLLEPLRDPTIGLVGPHVLNPDRTTQRSCSLLPSISGLLLFASGIHLLLPDSVRRHVAPVNWSHDRSTDTGWVGGSCLAMRSADFARAGTFSEATFMYGEDLDLGWRVKRLGKRVRFEHAAEIVHHQDVSSSQRWTPEELAQQVVEGELTFLRNRYPRPLANIAQGVLFFALASRAWLLRQLGRDRSRIYDSMAAASRPRRTC